jgi:hypothetical protein
MWYQGYFGFVEKSRVTGPVDSAGEDFGFVVEVSWFNRQSEYLSFAAHMSPKGVWIMTTLIFSLPTCRVLTVIEDLYTFDQT